MYSYDRRTAGLANTICRGFVIHGVDLDLELAEKLLAGKLDLRDLLKLVPLRTETVGEWWWMIQKPSDLKESQAYAVSGADTLSDNLYRLDDLRSGEDDDMFTDMAVVLIGKRPEGWDSQNNEEPWMDPQQWPTVRLTHVLYLDGKDRWQKVNAPLTVRI